MLDKELFLGYVMNITLKLIKTKIIQDRCLEMNMDYIL